MNDDRVSEEGDAIRRALLAGFLPLWFVPGLFDYLYHRRAKIEETSGSRESLVHAAMFGVVGIPVTAALFFEIDGFILTSAVVAALVHEAFTLYDVAYANDRRTTGPNEQHVHSFLEVMPFVGALLLGCAHPEAVASLREPLTGLRPTWKLKKRPVSGRYLAAFFSAVTAFIVVPYAEEFVRCFRVDRSLREHPLPIRESANER